MSIASLPNQSSFPHVSPGRRSSRFMRYCNVIYALMMHDIKNRFFGSGLGQIVMVFWPFVHIVVIVTLYVVTHRPNPYGESLIQYSAVSLFPFICFSYVSRWIVFSAMSNRSFLQYPIIKPLDLLVARALLEIVSITMVAVLLVITVVSLGFSALPQDPVQAICAFGACLALAIGMGTLNAAFAFVVPMWSLIYVLVIILAYVTSGILFVAAKMPEQFRTPLSYNPLLICVEWMRSAYYSDYPTLMIDRFYVFKFSLICLTLGVILVRALRRFI